MGRLHIRSPLGKEQIGNEQKGFGVRHAFVRGVGGGAVLPSDQAEIYIKFPLEGCSYTFEEASKAVFVQFPNAKGREKGLAVIRVSLADEACVTVSGFGMPFANADDAQVEGWDVFKLKNFIKANGGHQFETADSHPDGNHHMTAVNQSNVQDVMWLDDAAIEIAVTKFPAYFVRPDSGAPTP